VDAVRLFRALAPQTDGHGPTTTTEWRRTAPRQVDDVAPEVRGPGCGGRLGLLGRQEVEHHTAPRALLVRKDSRGYSFGALKIDHRSFS